MSATVCLGCGAVAVEGLLDFGEQPPSNRFIRIAEPNPDVHPLSIGQCGACALVQLINAMPATMVRPRFTWLTYSEPESHLDQFVARLVRLDGITKDSIIRGLTYLDDSTLARFNRLGCGKTLRYDLRRDLASMRNVPGWKRYSLFWMKKPPKNYSRATVGLTFLSCGMLWSTHMCPPAFSKHSAHWSNPAVIW